MLGFFKMQLKLKLTYDNILCLTMSIDHKTPWYKFLGVKFKAVNHKSQKSNLIILKND